MNAMSRDTNSLIADLVGGLEPIRPLRFSSGLGFALGGLGVILSVVALLFGIRPDVLVGSFDPVFLLATGLFLLLGLAASATVIVMSRPHVGSDHSGWRWAAAMTALLPLAAIITGIARGPAVLSATEAEHGLDCLMAGSALGLLIAAVLVWWLRRGAPTSPERAGLLTGIAAGSFGIFAFSFHCQYNDIVHIGLWHGLAVVVSAALGRLIVPRLIRW
ncbi:DUF1109 domain-containing protein [Sphingomonas sp.]|uniref:DUF1109 domain-containing protein n=1 Tax=Sphingomonas sp. TaxID=28214 RepID=UPI00307CE7FF